MRIEEAMLKIAGGLLDEEGIGNVEAHWMNHGPELLEALREAEEKCVGCRVINCVNCGILERRNNAIIDASEVKGL